MKAHEVSFNTIIKLPLKIKNARHHEGMSVFQRNESYTQLPSEGGASSGLSLSN